MSNIFTIGHTQPRPGFESDQSVEVRTGTPVKLDIPTLLDTRMIVCANSGGGKSWLFRLIAERTGKRVPTWIIDPEGEYASLRELLDLAVVGGAGEIPLTVGSAALTARRLYESGVGAVFDLSDLDIDDKRAAVDRILVETLRVAKHPLHPLFIFVDEAHQLCPQVGSVESSTAIKRMMDTGRKREICGLLATQRVTKLHNDAIGEARNVAIGLTVLGADQERAGDLLGMNKQQRGALAGLGKGEFYLYGPAVQGQGVQFFKSDQVQTTHPQPGKRHLVEVPPASNAIKKLLAHLGDLPAQAQEETNALEAARNEVARLQLQLKVRPTQLQLSPPEIQYVEVEKRVLNGEGTQLLEAVHELVAFGLQQSEYGMRIIESSERVTTAANRVAEAIHRFERQPAPALPARTAVPVPAPAKPRANMPPRETAPAGASALEGLSAPQQKILDTLYEFEHADISSVWKHNIAVLVQLTPGQGGINNYLGNLRSRGLIEYPTNGFCALTPEGRFLARRLPQPLTRDDLHAAWYAVLKDKRADALRVLISAHPNAVLRDEVATAVGLAPGQGGINNVLGNLRNTLDAIEYPAKHSARARDLLFPEGLG